MKKQQNNIMKIWTPFWNLSWNNRKLLLKTFFLMIKVRLTLWIVPFSRFQKSYAQIEPDPVKNDIPVCRLIWSVKVISPYVPRATCLTNALTGQSLLSQHGYPSLVKIGVGKSAEGQFEAHAWLEYNGKAVVGESEKDFIPLYDLKE